MSKIEEIKKYIIENASSKLSKQVLDYYVNYFTVLEELNLIPEDKNIFYFIDKVLQNIKDYVFYDNKNDELLKELGIGPKNKGAAINQILYINKNQSEEMIEITFYHELTHLLQNHDKNIKDEDIGVMKNYNYRILMEAQTQNLAELVYEKVHNLGVNYMAKDSETLRMVPGGLVKSSLRNYELYDNILREILLVLNISMEDFIRINFNEEKSYDIFEKLIMEKFDEDIHKFFKNTLDIIYSTDVLIYVNGDDELLEDPFIVESLIDGREINCSSKNQTKKIGELEFIMYYLIMKQENRINARQELSELLIFPQLLQEKIYLPRSPKYASQTYTNIESVIKNPELFVMTECIDACKELWSKNIYTFMVSDYALSEYFKCWIALDALSPENKKVLEELKNDPEIIIDNYRGADRILINNVGTEAQKKLLEVAKRFKIQDVQNGIERSYYSKEEFLIKIGCYKVEDNPEYYFMESPYELEFSSIEEQIEYMRKYKEWESSIKSQKSIKVLDKTKVNKSIEDYAKENNAYILGDKIFTDKFHYYNSLKYQKLLADEFLYSSHYENGCESLVSKK